MTQPPRCEPPEGRRGKKGWHWLSDHSGKSGVMGWSPKANAWVHGNSILGPEDMEFLGYRYICPVPSPEELAAPVRAARAILKPSSNETQYDQRRADLDAALLPFKETPDAE